MCKLLFIYESEMPTVSITSKFWTNLDSIYDVTTKFIRIIDVKTSDINWCDILLLIRPNNALSWRIAQKARKSGRMVITMCDDDLLHLPKGHPDLPWQRNGLIKTLCNSNVLLSSSKYLVEQMVNYTIDKRGVYGDTVVKPEELLERNYEEEENEIVRLVYAAGGGQHETLFEQLALPALKEIGKLYAKKVSLTFIDVHPKCYDLDKFIPVKYVKGMPLLQYRKYMEEQKFDIGISPLEDTPFTRCKYFNKYLEYTLSGVAGIYSNVEPYTYVVKDGWNGFLVENTKESWTEQLIRAIEDISLRHSCAKNAQLHVVENFNEKAIMQRYFDEIPELKNGIPNKVQCRGFVFWNFYYRVLRGLEFGYKFFFYLRTEGFSSVIRKTTARFKRMISK